MIVAVSEKDVEKTKRKADIDRLKIYYGSEFCSANM